VQHTYFTNELAEYYCLVAYEKRQRRLAAWTPFAGEPAAVIYTVEDGNTLLPRY
jgi:hypothetical protein